MGELYLLRTIVYGVPLLARGGKAIGLAARIEIHSPYHHMLVNFLLTLNFFANLGFDNLRFQRSQRWA